MSRFLQKLAINFKYAFRPKKPILTLRLVKTMLGVFLLGKRPLRYVDMAIDYKCNLKCEHCFKVSLEKDPHRELRRMGVSDYERVSKECMELGAVNFSFQGGEVFLYEDWEKVIKACSPAKNVISVTTNGTMLTDANLEKLRRVGVDILTVSLDSAMAEEHDRFRGIKGTHERVVSGIDRALAKGFSVTVGTTVTHSNLRSPGITGLIDFALKRKLILNLILAVPAGKWQDNLDLLINEDDMKYIRTLVASSPYIRTDFEANFKHWGCGAIKEILYLTPYGEVLPCPFMHISFGNVMEEPVSAIRSRALSNRYFAQYHQECLVAEDAEFIDKYLSKTFGAKDLPLRHDRVFDETVGRAE